MTLTLTFQWWELALASPLLMLWGFMLYAGALRGWHPALPIWVKVVLFPPLIVFLAFDVVFRFTVGAIILLDPLPSHGLTFSAALCYWFEKGASYRYQVAVFFAWLLNSFDDKHIS